MPIDLSIPLKSGSENPKCFYAPDPVFEAVRAGDFIGDLEMGGAVNFKNVSFNPHGNGTHTESIAHISPVPAYIGSHFTSFHFIAQLITCHPKQNSADDFVIERDQIPDNFQDSCSALIIRTEPNSSDKKTRNYSGKNAPYITEEAMQRITSCGISHLLIDLPSVDKEEDGGRLPAHRAFFGPTDHPRKGASITEMVYIPDDIDDGLYLLNLQIPNFQLDAAPSRPVIYALSV